MYIYIYIHTYIHTYWEGGGALGLRADASQTVPPRGSFYRIVIIISMSTNSNNDNG